MFTFSQSVQQVIVIIVTLVLITFLVIEKIKPSYVFFSAILFFLITGILDTGDLLKAVANESILIIFLLIFITAGIKNHFNLINWMDKLFGKAKTGKGFMLRMTAGVAGMSSVLNNTPLVALFLPYVYQWAKRRRVAPSKLLIPLSYAAIVGGMITVIGTSANLVLVGLIQSKGAPQPAFLDFLLPGLLVTISGIFYLYVAGYRLLPSRNELLTSVSGKAREYLAEVRVVPGSEVIGKSILEANLRNLNGIYLFEIVRRGARITPVEPSEKVVGGDALIFAGDTRNIMELLDRSNDFEVPFFSSVNGIDSMNILEIVIPINSEIIGNTLKKLNFREEFDAAVVAIHRNGEKLRGKIGEVILQAGDLLLVVPGKTFKKRIDENQNLYLVSVVRQVAEVTRKAKNWFLIILGTLLLGMIFGKLSLFIGLLILISYMVVSKLLTIEQIKQNLDVNLLVVLVASLAFSSALINSGTANWLAGNFMGFFQSFGNRGILVGIYLVTLVLTTFVNHVAAVAIIFPIAYSIVLGNPGINQIGIFIAIAFAASASFHSPFSYQTNMMVYGPGGYRFKDFLKVGIPFTLIYSAVVLLFIILFYQI